MIYTSSQSDASKRKNSTKAQADKHFQQAEKEDKNIDMSLKSTFPP